jgi:hypothetical protein
MAIGVRGWGTVHRHRTLTLKPENGLDSTRHVQPTAARSRHAWTLHVGTLAKRPNSYRATPWHLKIPTGVLMCPHHHRRQTLISNQESGPLSGIRACTRGWIPHAASSVKMPEIDGGRRRRPYSIGRVPSRLLQTSLKVPFCSLAVRRDIFCRCSPLPKFRLPTPDERRSNPFLSSLLLVSSRA